MMKKKQVEILLMNNLFFFLILILNFKFQMGIKEVEILIKVQVINRLIKLQMNLRLQQMKKIIIQ